MRRTFAIFFAAFLASSLFCSLGRAENTAETINFDDIYIRSYAVGFNFEAADFFSGPSEIKIQRDGTIGINNPATKGWVYGKIDKEKITQTLSEINKSNFRTLKWDGGNCGFHAFLVEMSVTSDGKKYVHSGCADLSLPKELSTLWQQIFKIADEFITNSFMELSNTGNPKTALELSFKFAPQRFEFETAADNTNLSADSLKEAYFWASVANINSKRMLNPESYEDVQELSVQKSVALARKLRELDDGSLAEMNGLVENWRSKHSEPAAQVNGDNK